MADPHDELDRKIEAEFKALGQSEFYPGSRHKRRPLEPKRETSTAAESSWDEHPKVMQVKGKAVEFFTIGQLAAALNRKPVTIRSWEQKGAIPRARYRTPPPHNRRLYTRRQVEGLIDICERHGLLHFSVRPQAESLSPAFTAEVEALWREPL